METVEGSWQARPGEGGGQHMLRKGVACCASWGPASSPGSPPESLGRNSQRTPHCALVSSCRMGAPQLYHGHRAWVKRGSKGPQPTASGPRVARCRRNTGHPVDLERCGQGRLAFCIRTLGTRSYSTKPSVRLSESIAGPEFPEEPPRAPRAPPPTRLHISAGPGGGEEVGQCNRPRARP